MRAYIIYYGYKVKMQQQAENPTALLAEGRIGAHMDMSYRIEISLIAATECHAGICLHGIFA